MIDLDNYGVIGYANVPSYAIPHVATPHLVETDWWTMCRRKADLLVPRAPSYATWQKPICKTCLRRAMQ